MHCLEDTDAGRAITPGDTKAKSPESYDAAQLFRMKHRAPGRKTALRLRQLDAARLELLALRRKSRSNRNLVLAPIKRLANVHYHQVNSGRANVRVAKQVLAVQGNQHLAGRLRCGRQYLRIGTAFTSPFWLMYRGRFPYFLVVLLVFAWVFGSFVVSDMACRMAGQPSPPWWAYLYPSGLLIASVKAYKDRRG